MENEAHRRGPREPLGAKFRALLGSYTTANAADGLVYTALPLLALTFDPDPVSSASPRVAAQAAPLAVGLFVGLTVDRVNRRTLALVSNSARCLLVASLILVIYFARASPVHMIATIVVFALLWAILENLFDTAGAASIPAAVAGHQLETANGLLTAAQRIVQGFVFVPIAAAALAFHAPFPFILAGILMLASSLLARRISPGIRLSKDDASPVHEKWHTAISEGFRFIFATPSLRALVLLNAILLILLQFSQGAIAYYLIYTIGMPSAAFGLVLVGPAAGSVLGALSAKRIADRIGTKASMIVGALSLAIGLIALGLTPQRPWIALAVTLVLLAVSVGTGWWNVLAMSFIQRIVPAGLLGRVTGSIGTVIGAVLPLATLGGAIVSRWEPRLPWLMGGVLAIVATVGFVRGLPDHASSP